MTLSLPPLSIYCEHTHMGQLGSVITLRHFRLLYNSIKWSVNAQNGADVKGG